MYKKIHAIAQWHFLSSGTGMTIPTVRLVFFIQLKFIIWENFITILIQSLILEMIRITMQKQTKKEEAEIGKLNGEETSEADNFGCK